ncbi:sulfite exporter TauE/SafE family protein [Rhizorhabdus histidinilytica]|uniref:Sulfite exporter TauE/SafE n=2 Tax=Rhizorhabdus histidinilytica TaxID=439228 RepID=A0A1T5B7W7_9SPHN|nr:sulfite exporter TauE/SafE family protein [Rhizorhabdus histidinilytica]SKB43352.1 Sulfite exporter TauE/SafE [Rhizorhabdus histidinilytica]
MPLIDMLLAILGALTLVFVVQLGRRWLRDPVRPRLEGVALSAVANFFDALGIGSFAPSTAYLKIRRLTPDELIPSTMIAGYTIATVTEAFVYITSIVVDPVLLVASILASSVGAVAGVILAPRLPVRAIQTTIGVGLLIAASLYALSNLGLMPGGGTATALPPSGLALVVAVSFALGILTNLGIGSFAPTLILLSLLGMDPRAAFPIMMGSAAFIFVASATTIVRTRPLDLSLVGGMAIGGAPAVLLAAYLIKSLPLHALRWGVVVVVAYAAVLMLRSAIRSRRRAGDPAAPAGPAVQAIEP